MDGAERVKERGGIWRASRGECGVSQGRSESKGEKNGLIEDKTRGTKNLDTKGKKVENFYFNLLFGRKNG